MKKNYLILIILIQLNSYLTNGQISVMTFNIRYDNPKDNQNWWEYRKSSVVQMFNFYSPEIIGIQEGLYHQLKYIKNSLPEYDYVGVGSDYDGLDCLPKEWNDCRDHIKIAERLENRGYNQEEIEKVMGKNILRVLEEINY